MSRPGEAFSRYAVAERELCEQAGAVLAAVIEGIQIRLGVHITEAHVTVDRDSNGSLKATCTIAGAHSNGVGPAKGIGETEATQRDFGVQPPLE